ncbi:MAG TPA: glycosyltransferase family 2 protein, partial [Alphaproteobacteria bacterium]|nr:glycosyltransferase family 2 protein [Alphaproteobacteria bacterium]
MSILSAEPAAVGASEFGDLSIAVVIPCLNEEVSIGAVVEDFRRVLPGADVYVYDNNSTDGTGDAARAAGAIVRLEPEPGKGNVVRRIFSDIDADIYVLVDGDATYPADAAPEMIRLLLDDHLDMVCGTREAEEK